MNVKGNPFTEEVTEITQELMYFIVTNDATWRTASPIGVMQCVMHLVECEEIDPREVRIYRCIDVFEGPIITDEEYAREYGRGEDVN